MTARILLIGTGDGSGAPEGRATDIGRRVVSGPPAGCELRFLDLPSDPDAAMLKALETVDLHLPEAVLSLTTAPSRRAIVATSARNVDDPSRGAGEGGAGPIDPSGPEVLPCTLPAERIAASFRDDGIVAAAGPIDVPACNRLLYALLRYVQVRGAETWFRRKPPSGLDSRIGAIQLPAGAARSEGEDGPARLAVSVGRALGELAGWLADGPARSEGG